MKKPQAFRRYVHREGLFPRTAFRRAWDRLEASVDERKACRTYVGLLHLAATQACDARLAAWLDDLLDQDGAIDLEAARLAMAPPAFAPPRVTIAAPDIAAYDALFGAPLFEVPIGAA